MYRKNNLITPLQAPSRLSLRAIRKAIRHAALTCLLAAAPLASAQYNSSLADGYLSRGLSMYADANYVGATDQLTQLLRLKPDPAQLESARFYLAMSAMRLGDAGALEAIQAFIRDYPVSFHRVDALIAEADYFYDRQEYAEALARYRAIDPDALIADSLANYLYHKAYCMLMLADYSGAASIYDTLAASPYHANEARFYLGFIDYVKGDYAAARKQFEKVDRTGNPALLTDFYLAQIVYNDGDFPAALAAAEKLLRADVDETYLNEMRRIAGESLYHLGRDRDAVRHLQAYVDAAENPLPSALYVLGISQYRSANYADAVRSLTPVVDQENAMGQSACLYVGQALLHSGNYDGALMAFDKAQRLSFDPEVQETAFYNYAVASMRGGRQPFGSTVAKFEDFLQRYPKSQYAPEIQEYVVTGYMTDNNYSGALASINRIKNPTEKVLRAKQQVLYTLGTRELAAGQSAAAIDHLRQAKALARFDSDLATEADFWIGEALYRQGSYAEAAESYRSYLAAAPKRAANRPLANYALGYALFADRRFPEASEAFQQAVKAPGSLDTAKQADALNRTADCLYYASDFQGAAAVYDRAYDLDPAAGDYPLYQKAVMKGLVRDHQAKIQDLALLISRFPSSALVPSSLLEMGESYTDLGRSDKAIETFSNLALNYPATSQGRQGYLLLAITYLNAGNTPQAIQTYKKVISNFPTSDEARAAADDLKHIYADRGQLDEYLAFVQSVPNAPQLEPSEVDQLTFAAAERALAERSDSAMLRDYVEKFPQGASRADALALLVDAEKQAGNTDRALAYAAELVENYPDASATLLILPVKAEIEASTGRGSLALASYELMEQRASDAATLAAARLGTLRVASSLGRHEVALAAADRLLGSANPLGSEQQEVMLRKADALAALGRTAEARELWATLADNPSDVFGAEAAVSLAQNLFDSGDIQAADRAVNALIDANSPHDYWLARAFILLSDVRRSQGEDFEANEYLRSLRENYPGSEADIFRMIDDRLK